MKQPSAAQKRFLNDVVEFISGAGLGVLYPGYENRTDFHIHHCVGRSAKHNKIPIGHWFILPVPVELHDVASNHPMNVTHFKKRFCEAYGRQSHLFERLIEMMYERYKIPSYPVCMAIEDTKE